MKKFLLQTFSRISQSFIDLAFPPSCLSCHQVIFDSNTFLCNSCINQLDLLNPLGRCSKCFKAMDSPKKIICYSCSKKSDVIFDGVAAAFDYAGPAACMIRQLKYADQPYLAKGLSAYLTAQFIQLNWDIPDIIIPVPITFGHWLQRGFNQSLLLAQGMSDLLQCDVQEALVRKNGDYSQAGLTKKQRMQLKGERFILNENIVLHDKTILIIDDVMTTGTTLEHCGKVLLNGCPNKIYALTVCKSLE